MLGSHVGQIAQRLEKKTHFHTGWLTSVHHNQNASLVAYMVYWKPHSVWETKYSPNQNDKDVGKRGNKVFVSE